jgi:hypothetical protein
MAQTIELIFPAWPNAAQTQRLNCAKGQDMISTIVRFRLPPGETHADAMAEIQKTLPIYQAAAPALIRKAIHLDMDAGVGTSIYLWADRAPAEAFFARASEMIKAKTGHAPDVEYLDCDILVDNSAGEVHVF